MQRLLPDLLRLKKNMVGLSLKIMIYLSYQLPAIYSENALLLYSTSIFNHHNVHKCHQFDRRHCAVCLDTLLRTARAQLKDIPTY